MAAVDVMASTAALKMIANLSPQSVGVPVVVVAISNNCAIDGVVAAAATDSALRGPAFHDCRFSKHQHLHYR